jgi:hypothetical protein
MVPESESVDDAGSLDVSVSGVSSNDTTLDDSTRRDTKGGIRASFKDRFLKEVRTHPFGYSVLAVFLLAGPIAAPFLFPQAPPAAAVVGGLAFGVYAALSAVPQKFL